MFGKHDLYVSPDGNDAWSGRLAEPNTAGTDGPLVSVGEARSRIRGAKGSHLYKHQELSYAGLAGPLTVWLREGRYPVTEPLVFGPEDSAPVTYASYPGETAVIDGGERITDWSIEEVNGCTVWVANLPEVAEGKWHFRQLFVNGERRARPRLPKQGLHRMEDVPGMPLPASWGNGGQTGFVCAEGDVKPFTNLGDVEVVYVHFWIEERSPIESFDPASRLVTMTRPSRSALVGSHGSQLADYYLDNVYEALGEPGEWYLDRAGGRLVYLPMPGETPEETEVYAPRCLQLLALKGDTDGARFVEYLRFKDLTFRHTDWRHPDASDGAEFIGPSGDDGKLFSRRHRRGNTAGGSQAASDVPGVIFMESAHHCSIEDCTIEHVGWYGVQVADACHGIRVVGNTIRDLGAGGVKIGGASAQDPPHRRTGNHRVTDNHIHAGGRVFHSGVGVLSMHAHEVAICHNHIHDLYYSGISCGWVWGYAENVSRDNLIEKNHIHDIGQGLLSDMGGIYTLGVQPGTVLRGNLIHDVTKAHYGAWCIYPDEGSSHILIENNVCYRTNGEAFHQHYGRENVVRNNVFAFGGEAQLAHGKVDAWHKAFVFERNIVLTDGVPIFAGGYNCRLADRNHISDLNLFFDVAAHALTFKDRNAGETVSWDEWQALGHDAHSIAVDPKCADVEKGDFSIAGDSPALALGFRPIDLSDVGPRARGERG